jgi:acyl-[acyl-carrier-protein] desaturase
MNKRFQERINDSEIVNMLEPFVRERLKYLVGDKRKWWPSKFFDFMESKDGYSEELTELREEARGLRDEELVVLVGNEVTEEALPNYTRALANFFPEATGISENAWNLWERGWTAEEDMHGAVLNRYSILHGRVNIDAVDRSRISLNLGGMEGQPDIYRGLIYPAFQEPATAISHMNMARIAKSRGVQTLYKICSNIASDESRHAKFYGDIVSELMNIAPERLIISFFDLMKDKVVMPARRMTDDTYTEPPTLFEHFSGVANKIGVYTAFDYANIVEKLNKNFRTAEVSLKDAGAEAQDYLCQLPEKLRRVAERKRFRVSEPVGFDWIYGRKA